MRLGLVLWPDRDARLLAELATAAEDAGFDDLWWPDHYYAREAAAVLALAAASTRRIRLGTAVTSPLLRHPAILASLFATLHELSDGRALAGLGPGGFELKTQLAVTTPSPLSATREAVEMLRDMLAGKAAAAPDARVFPVPNAQLGFTGGAPVPIYLAARGPRMMELAGEVADGLITHGVATAFLDFAKARLAEGAARAGRDPAGCELAVWLEIARGDGHTYRDTLRRRCLYMVGGEFSESLIPLYGLDPERVAPVRAAVRAQDPDAYRLIDDRMVDAFAVGGPPNRVADELLAVADAGAGQIILSPGEGVDASEIAALGTIARRALS